MNARKVMNGTLATLLFAWAMGATLPALNHDVLSPFEAFVLTPSLLMIAALAGLGIYHGLDRLERRVFQGLTQLARGRARGDCKAVDFKDWLTGRAQ